MAKRIRRKAGKGGPRGGRRRTTWKPGIPSPNPKGRPKIPAEHKAALKMLDPMAAQAAGEILADPSHKDRARITEAVWNRVHGMPKQRVEASGPDGGPIAIKTVLTSDEKRARAAALLAKATGITKTGDDEAGEAD